MTYRLSHSKLTILGNLDLDLKQSLQLISMKNSFNQGEFKICLRIHQVKRIWILQSSSVDFLSVENTKL
jgi:hypothetical protein